MSERQETISEIQAMWNELFHVTPRLRWQDMTNDELVDLRNSCASELRVIFAKRGQRATRANGGSRDGNPQYRRGHVEYDLAAQKQSPPDRALARALRNASA